MIYLNNAATSYPKPEGMAEAVASAIKALPGSAHRTGFEQERSDTARSALARLLRTPDENSIVYASNATHALNVAFHGIDWKEGDVALTSSAEHNSVLRPLHLLQKRGALRMEIVQVDSQGRLDPNAWRDAVKKHRPRLAVFTHASNVTGAVNDAELICSIAKEEADSLVLLDASQSAGVVDLFPSEWNIDMVAMTGHKYLLGPQGTGALYVNPEIKLEPMWTGGTGIFSDMDEMPDQLPLRLEAGTPNEHSFAGLKHSLNWREQNPEDLEFREKMLGYAVDSLRESGANVIDVSGVRTPVISFTLPGWEIEDVGHVLQSSYDIICRTGLHCAPRIFGALGCSPQGTVRVSLSRFTLRDEIDVLTCAVKDMMS